MRVKHFVHNNDHWYCIVTSLKQVNIILNLTSVTNGKAKYLLYNIKQS